MSGSAASAKTVPRAPISAVASTVPRRVWPRTLRWRVHIVVIGLLTLLIVTAAVTTASRLYATSVGDHVRETLRPAQQAAAALNKDYVDMESGTRGFLLTSDASFLDPYESGQADAALQERQLRDLLPSDAESVRLLDALDAAGASWRQQSIDPALDRASPGALDSAAIVRIAMAGKETFAVVRARVAQLRAHIDELTGAGLAASTGASSTANMVTIGCAALALLLGAVSVLLLRRSLDAPLRRLVAQVTRVSDGELDARVDAGGPQELAELGRAVEAMRHRIRGEIGRTTEAAAQVLRLEETDRIARELGDTVVKRLFAIGLTLQSEIARHPAARGVFTRVSADLDDAINQLRSSLYGHVPEPRQSLGMAVQTLVSEFEAEAGVVPALVLTGDLDSELPARTIAEVLSVLTDALGVLVGTGHAGSAQIELVRDSEAIRLRLSGLVPGDESVLDTLPGRARLLSGDAAVTHQGDRVTIDWWVPA